MQKGMIFEVFQTQKGEQMDNNTNTFSVKTLLILAGSYVSFGIGAGFATGAELLQFWAPHGSNAIFGLIISAALILLCIAVVSRDCRKYKLVNMEMMYKHYCGKYIGAAIQWFNTLTFFLMVGSMIAGGASSLNQAFGLPIFAGTVIMLATVLATALMGMKRLTDILGNIAPIIIISVIIICIFSYMNGTVDFSAGDQLIREKSGLSMSGSLIFSAVLNFTYVVLNMSAYSANVSTRADHQKELVWGNVLGQFITVLSQTFIFIAFILNATLVAGTDIPLLMLAQRLGTAFYAFYGIIVVLATYTTATGMAWVAASNIQHEDSKWYKPVVAAVCIGAFIFSNFGSFGVLMNLVMKMVSYLGVAFSICVIVSKIYRAVKEPKETSAE